jgi:UDP-N-acetylglucosamine--N-acetylmuramyl-(pentapeptide) pyrophosphoryl-undecaprenol N-acetylglucosamine transferase
MTERMENAAAPALPVVVLAGGGTGGHVFPMVAVADALRAEADVRVVYVGTARGIEARVVPARGDELELLDVLPIKGRGAIGAVRGTLRAVGTLPRARALVKRLAPRAVLSVGGYAAGPLGLAAWSRRVPLALLEPNSVLGLANRWLVPFARRAYVAFPGVADELGRIAQRTGVPLRAAFHAAPYVALPGRLRVLVLGGSQGAKALNEVVPEALALASRDVGPITVVHQAGRDQDEAVRSRYREHGVEGVSVVAFIDDVARELERADLVIERSGASSLAELCAVGRCSILIPFPFAADDHQRKNAKALEAEGAASCVDPSDATAARIANSVASLARDPGRRSAMADAARTLGRPDAARAIARDLLALAGIPIRATGTTANGGGEDASATPTPSTTATASEQSGGWMLCLSRELRTLHETKGCLYIRAAAPGRGKAPLLPSSFCSDLHAFAVQTSPCTRTSTGTSQIGGQEAHV